VAAQQQQIAALYAKVTLQMRGAQDQLREFRGRLSQATNNLKTMRDQAKISGVAIGALLTAPLALFGKTAIASVAEYQKSMDVFKLVTKASGEQMSLAAAEVEKLAHDLELPQFTKADAAAALLELGKAGLGAQGAVEALRPALLLAGAGEVKATEGAALLAGALQSWKLPASQAGAVADMLAATMKHSGIEFDQLRDTVKQAGPAFATAGVPMDTFLTLVGELGRLGIKGGEAGTVLRNMMLGLLAPTDEANALLKGMGVQIYDANNKMRPFRDVIADMKPALDKMSEAHKNAALATIFGKDTVGAARLIFEGGTKAYDEMHESVIQVGAAHEIAAAKTAGLSGGIADVGREAQNASTSAFAPMADSLNALAHGLADGLRWFQSLPEPVKEIVGAVAILLPIIAALELAWLALGPAIGLVLGVGALILPILEAVGALLAITVAGGIGAVLLPLAFLAAAFYLAYTHSETFRTIVDGAFAVVKDAAVSMWNRVQPIFSGFIGAIQGVIDAIGRLTGIHITLPSLPSLPNLIPTLPRVVNVGGGVGSDRNQGMAGGGPVSAGNSYLVGEQGPEMFVPGRSGTIVPNGGDTYMLSFAGANFYGSSPSDFEDMVVRALDVARRRGR
jgi:TP901 family phage tail tape measure protein